MKPVQARCVNAASASLDVNVKSKSLSQSSKLENVISIANAVGDFLTRPSKPLTEHEEQKMAWQGKRKAGFFLPGKGVLYVY